MGFEHTLHDGFILFAFSTTICLYMTCVILKMTECFRKKRISACNCNQSIGNGKYCTNLQRYKVNDIACCGKHVLKVLHLHGGSYVEFEDNTQYTADAIVLRLKVQRMLC